MIRNTLTFLIFGAVVLLVGQIHFGGRSLAERFQNQAEECFYGGSRRLMKTKVLASLSDSFLARWIHNIDPPRLPVKQKPSGMKAADEPEGEDADSDRDEFSSADRESILRLLP